MNKYINVKNGTILEVESVIDSTDWVVYEEVKESVEEVKENKKATKNKKDD